MSGIYGVASKEDCTELLFYGTDYHSHLGTEYGGLAVLGDDFKIMLVLTISDNITNWIIYIDILI